MKEQVIIAGFGGQGIIFAGQVLAMSAMLEGYQVAMVSSYGAETRGGTVNVMLTISDQEIDSPFIENADTLIIMNQPSLQRFENVLKTGGLLLVNSSLIKKKKLRKDIKIVKVPANEIAHRKVGHDLANMVMIGRYVKYKKIVKPQRVLEALDKILLEKGKKELFQLNQKAFLAGMK